MAFLAEFKDITLYLLHVLVQLLRLAYIKIDSLDSCSYSTGLQNVRVHTSMCHEQCDTQSPESHISYYAAHI